MERADYIKSVLQNLDNEDYLAVISLRRQYFKLDNDYQKLQERGELDNQIAAIKTLLLEDQYEKAQKKLADLEVSHADMKEEIRKLSVIAEKGGQIESIRNHKAVNVQFFDLWLQSLVTSREEHRKFSKDVFSTADKKLKSRYQKTAKFIKTQHPDLYHLDKDFLDRVIRLRWLASKSKKLSESGGCLWWVLGYLLLKAILSAFR